MLLILAGISISMLSGDNSILTRATEAKRITGEKSISERVQLAYIGALAVTRGQTSGDEFTNTLEEELNKEFGTGNYTLANDNTKVTIEGTEYGFDGTISGGTTPSQAASRLTTDEQTAIAAQNTATPSDQIGELTSTQISALTNGSYLSEIGKIKAVLTGGVPIPVNTTYKEGTKSTGVVIEYKSSEFVWVPVPEINKMVMCTEHQDGDCDIHINSAGDGLECRTEAHKVNNEYNSEIVGRLYATDTGNNFNANLTTQTYTPNNGLREPAIITGNSEGTGIYNDGSASYYNTILGYNSSADFLEALKLEYKTMALGVAKYGGFYIGRYETSIDGTTVASKKSPVETGTGAIMPMSAATDNQRWYGMYSKQKAFSTSGLQSSMIWGSQYDAMLKWVLGGVDASHVTATTNGNHTNFVKGTGSTSTDKMNNIYDLEGNLKEWTLEADYGGTRIYRGGYYGVGGFSSSYRYYDTPLSTYDDFGSRLSLYIK